MATFYFSNLPHATAKSGEKIDTRKHYDYISREGKYKHIKGRQEDLVYKSYGNMPTWATQNGKVSARKFWEEAEKHRSGGKGKRGGRAYREIRFALMEEFDLKTNIQLVETFLKRSGIKNCHAYSYAIHDKPAAFDKTHRNIHVHIMFSERIIEQDRPLAPDMYFKRYRNTEQGCTGGYKSSRYYTSQEAMKEMRNQLADIINSEYKSHGMEQRVSAKTLKAQKEEAEEKQDFLEATLKNRNVPPRIGNLYRNPKNMEYIQELTRQFEQAIDDPSKNDTIDQWIENNKFTKDENLMILLAQDLALRNAANNIRLIRERDKAEEKAMEERRQEEAAKEREYLASTPSPAVWAVNNGDLLYFIMEKEKEEKRQLALLEEEESKLPALMRSEEDSLKEAMNRMTHGRYYAAVTKQQNTERELEHIKEQESKYLASTDKDAASQYAKYLKTREEVAYRLDREKEEVRHIEKEMLPEKDAVEQLAKLIRDENVAALKKKRELRTQLLEKEKRLQVIRRKEQEIARGNLQQPLSAFDPKGANKLHGIRETKELPVVVYKGVLYQQYEEGDTEAKAIQKDAAPTDGSLPVYRVRYKDELGRKTIENIEPTAERIPVYEGYRHMRSRIQKDPTLAEHLKETVGKMENIMEQEYRNLFVTAGPERPSRTETKEQDRGVARVPKKTL